MKCVSLLQMQGWRYVLSFSQEPDMTYDIDIHVSGSFYDVREDKDRSSSVNGLLAKSTANEVMPVFEMPLICWDNGWFFKSLICTPSFQIVGLKRVRVGGLSLSRKLGYEISAR